MAATNADAMRYLATVKRQSAPPRCNPFTIVLQVLALGMVFIGLTMTIIAHWPGSTSIGENPLKIAGPILLSVGAVLFVIGIVLICCLNSRERRRWEKMIDNFASSSRAPIDQSSFGPSSQKVSNFDDSRGNAANAPLLASAQPPDNQSHLRPGKGFDGNDYYKLGDPYSGGANGGESSFTMDEDDGVPDPVRSTKKRRPKKSATGSNDDLSGGDNVVLGTSTTVTTTTTTVVKRSDGDGPGTEETTTTRTRRTKTRGMEDDMGAMDNGSAAAKPATKPKPGAGPTSSPGGTRLLVHVKAQPGATVHIHPSGPAPPPKPAFSSQGHSTSGETDI